MCDGAFIEGRVGYPRRPPEIRTQERATFAASPPVVMPHTLQECQMKRISSPSRTRQVKRPVA